jgi:uncharacterized protein (TIGR02757 family)
LRGPGALRILDGVMSSPARALAPSSGPAPLSMRPRSEVATLKRRLDRIHLTFDRSYLDTDPLVFVHRYESDEDREIVGFIAAGLAFGNVRSIQASVSALLDAMGSSPSAFIDGYDPERDARALHGLYHRWIRSEDLSKLVWVMARMRAAHGSIGGFFMEGYRPGDDDIGPSLISFCERARALAAVSTSRGSIDKFFPSPRAGSACKRLNLFLRWMVRGGDGLDLGLWKGVSRRQLVLPLDTHLVRLSRALRLTNRRSPGWLMAVEATRSLALLDPDDPVKYDFSLSRLGILDRCLHGRDPLDCRVCPAPRPRLRRLARRSR